MNKDMSNRIRPAQSNYLSSRVSARRHPRGILQAANAADTPTASILPHMHFTCVLGQQQCQTQTQHVRLGECGAMHANPTCPDRIRHAVTLTMGPVPDGMPCVAP